MAMNTHQVSQAATGAKNPVDAAQAKENQKKKARTVTDTVMDAFQGHVDKIAAQLGKSLDPQKFMASTVNAIARDPNLARCMLESPRTVIGGVYVAASLGFEINSPIGLCYLIPRYGKDKIASDKAGEDIYKWQANFQLGYQGTVTLLYRSGEISYIGTEEVYEEDHFKYQLGTNPFIEHIPYDGPNPGKVIKYYAVVKLKNGGSLFKVWSAEKVLEHAKQFSSSYSKKYDNFSGPWGKNFASMAKKTVLLDCMKLAPKSTQLAVSLATDNTVKSIPIDGSQGVSMLTAPNELFELENADAPQALPNNQSEEQPTGESAEDLRERLGLKRGSELPPKEGQMPVDAVI